MLTRSRARVRGGPSEENSAAPRAGKRRRSGEGGRKGEWEEGALVGGDGEAALRRRCEGDAGGGGGSGAPPASIALPPASDGGAAPALDVSARAERVLGALRAPAFPRGRAMVVILRGAPGSGKTTLARRLAQLARGPTWLGAADDFFTDRTGAYVFDPARLDEAHAACLRAFAEALRTFEGGGGLLVVHNTNTTFHEIERFRALALAHGAAVLVVRLAVPLDVCAARQEHGVPLDKIKAMHERLEVPLPPFAAADELLMP